MEKHYMEIMGNENDVSFEIPQVFFPSYKEYKEKATEVAAYISGMELTEENVKEIKKVLADARKLTDRLDRARIDMKNAILQNYLTFEAQIKEIAGIVDAADKDLRAKVKEMEEAERALKKLQISEIWKKRVEPFPIIEKIMPDAFDRWMTPKHLNKSVSMKSVESDMAGWMQKTFAEMESAQSMGDDYLAAYGRCGNLAEAITMVNDHRKALKEIEGMSVEEINERPTKTFMVIGAKDIALTERLFAENEIEYVEV